MRVYLCEQPQGALHAVYVYTLRDSTIQDDKWFSKYWLIRSEASAKQLT